MKRGERFRCTAAGALLALAGAFAPAPRADECDSVLVRSASVLASLAARGEDVERCIALASETVRAAYQSAYPRCRGLALAREVPTTIDLPRGRPVVPAAGVRTWEEFALGMGKDASESGCRDGVLSAVAQTLFASTDLVRSLFARKRLEFFDLLTGEHQISRFSHGSLEIASTAFFGHFRETEQIFASGHGQVRFERAPMQLDGHLRGKLRLFLLVNPVSLGIRVQGTATGALDTQDLTVTFERITIDALGIPDLGHVALPRGVEEVLLSLVRSQESRLTAAASQALTRELRQAYRSTDPFAFLSESP